MVELLQRGRITCHWTVNLRFSGLVLPVEAPTRSFIGGGFARILIFQNMRDAHSVVTFAMMLLGGGLAWLQLGSRADALIAFQIGLAAPMLLQKLAKSAPDRPGGMGLAARPSILAFLKGCPPEGTDRLRRYFRI
jgi:hypothetical protein